MINFIIFLLSGYVLFSLMKFMKSIDKISGMEVDDEPR